MQCLERGALHNAHRTAWSTFTTFKRVNGCRVFKLRVVSCFNPPSPFQSTPFPCCSWWVSSLQTQSTASLSIHLSLWRLPHQGTEDSAPQIALRRFSSWKVIIMGAMFFRITLLVEKILNVFFNFLIFFWFYWSTNWDGSAPGGRRNKSLGSKHFFCSISKIKLLTLVNIWVL